MKRSATIWHAALLAAALGPALSACLPERIYYIARQDGPVPPMSVAQAREVVRDTILHYPGGTAPPTIQLLKPSTAGVVDYSQLYDLSRVWMSSSLLAFGTADHETFVVRLAGAEQPVFTGMADGRVPELEIPWHDPRFPRYDLMDIMLSPSDTPGLEPGKRLVDALAVLKRAAQAGVGAASPAEEARFAQVAKTYRAAAVKPVPGEDVRRYAIEAQAAVQGKDFFGAADDYEQALAVAPWWPQGHLNRAFILAEIGEYGDAVREMQRYLALVPQAPDARQMQDQIYRWQAQAPVAAPAAAITAPAAPAPSSLVGGTQRALPSK